MQDYFYYYIYTRNLLGWMSISMKNIDFRINSLKDSFDLNYSNVNSACKKEDKNSKFYNHL